MTSWITRAALEALQPDAREAALQALKETIDERLWQRAGLNAEAFGSETKLIIDELRAAGHDLWSIDFDGDGRHLWGYDYMRPETAGRLQIQFDYNVTVAPCTVYWRGVNDRLGVQRPGEED